MAAAPETPFDLSPAGDPGRLTASYLHISAQYQILLLSAYFHTGEPTCSPANRAIWAAATEAIRAFKGFFVLTGDFQAEGEELQASGYLSSLRGKLYSPQEPTCNTGRIIDHFVVDARLAPMVVCCGNLGWKPRQHAPIYLELELPHKMPRAPRLIAPKKFPQDLPVGPVRAPPGVLTTTQAIFTSGDFDPDIAFKALVSANYVGRSITSHQQEILSLTILVGKTTSPSSTSPSLSPSSRDFIPRARTVLLD